MGVLIQGHYVQDRFAQNLWYFIATVTVTLTKVVLIRNIVSQQNYLLKMRRAILQGA